MAFLILVLMTLVGRAFSVGCSEESLEVQRVASVSPQCIRSCPHICKPIGAFITTYAKSGDQKAVEAQVCKFAHDLDCTFEAGVFEECQKIVSRFIGSKTQPAWGEFKQLCQVTQHCPGVRLEVQRVMSIAPQCLDVCPRLCRPVDAFMTKYKESGDMNAVKAEACHYTQELDCAFGPGAVKGCQKIVSRFIGSNWGEFKQLCQVTQHCPEVRLEVQRVMTIAPRCLDICPQLCRPVDAFMTKSKESSDLNAVKAEACHYTQELDCAFGPGAVGDCPKIVSMFVGSASQASWVDFKQSCSSRNQLESASAEACTGASLEVQRVVSIAPQCLETCPQLCTPLNAFMTRYKESGDVTAVKAQACDYTHELDCAFEAGAVGECQKIVSRFTGSTTRASWHQFKQACHSTGQPAPSAAAFLQPSASP